MSNLRTIVAVLAGLLLAGSLQAPLARADEPDEIVLVEAYLLAPDPTADGAWLVGVDEVLSGTVPGSVLAVDDLPAALEAVGERLRLVLTPDGPARYRVLSGHASPVTDPAAGAPETKPLAVLPGDTARRSAAREAEAEPEAPPGGGAFTLEPKAAPTPTFEDQVMVLVNQERWADGQKPPYKRNALLDSSSETHSSNMAARDFFAHCDLDTGTSPTQRANTAGYLAAVAENIAAGQSSPAAVMTSWMNSSGHRAAILSTGFREIGIGYVLQSNDQANVRLDLSSPSCVHESISGPFFRYWTQNFGARSIVYPVVIDREALTTDSTSVDLYVYGAGFASQMRFSNDGASWSAWQAYNPNKSWTLTGGAGWKTVHAQIRSSGGTVLQQSDTIYLDTPCVASPANLNLPNDTVNGTASYFACDTISALQGFQVNPGGELLFQAGNRVVLGDGFRVLSGGSLRVLIQPPP
jgi:uncharacterized protein YkwD